MSDLFGILITFGPLILIILLANLAERARERATLAQVTPVRINGVPRTDSLPQEVSDKLSANALLGETGSTSTYASEPETSPALQDDLWAAESTLAAPPPAIVAATPAPPMPAAPASDGTVWAILAYALMLLYFISFLVGAAVAAVMPFMLAQDTPQTTALLEATPFFARFNWNFLAIGTAITSFFGMFIMLRPVRRLLARFIPIDPLSTVHAVSLAMISLVALQMVFTAGVGIDVLADMATQGGDASSGAMTIASAWLQALLFFGMGAAGVGWLIRRNTHASRLRLGIVMPTIPQVLIAMGLGFAMVGVVLALEVVSNSLGWGFDEDVGRLSEQLLGGLILTVPGILTLGLSAGIGEETLMRGAVQPRFGLVLTSVIFALLHGNYGLTLSTLAVLIVGLTLGILRSRTNTTAAMIMHATYNCILGFLPFLWQQ